MTVRKELIKVALPLDAINKASVRERSVRSVMLQFPIIRVIALQYTDGV